MGIVTNLVPQKNKIRVNVFVDGKFLTGASLDLVVKNKLKIGGDINDEQIQRLLEEETKQTTFEKAVNFAMVRPRSIKEARDWGKRKKISPELVAEIIEKLEKYELVNDEHFAKWWVESRISFRAKSKTVIKLELLKKGISKDIIEKTFSEITFHDDVLAEQELAKKMKRWNNLPKDELYKKATAFLARRGFSWDVIKAVVAKYTKFSPEIDSEG